MEPRLRIEHGDPDTARRLLRQMAAGLASHWAGEENGIFRVMRQEPDYADYIAPLVAEHRNLRDTVDVTDATDQARIRDAVAELHEHISKAEDGLFPASLIQD